MPAPVLPDVCCNPGCDAPAFDQHHVVRRSYLAGAFDYVELFGRVWLNLAQVCRSCHDDLEQNRVQIMANLEGSSGYYTWGGRRLAPYPNPVLEDGEHGVTLPPVGGVSSPSSSTVVPGETCPTCARRVPHPRKPSSPKSKVHACRGPLDEAEGFADLLEAAMEHTAFKGAPHDKYRTIQAGLVVLIQDEAWRDYGRR